MANKINSPLILPHHSEVFGNLAHPFDDIISLGSLLGNLGYSLVRVLMGFALCLLIGIPLGVLMGYSSVASDLFTGVISLTRAIPALAWVPVVLAWFGTASLSSVFGIPIGPMYIFGHNIKFGMLVIIFLGGFFPIVTGAEHGVKRVPKSLIESSSMLGASKLDIFLKVLLPGAVPSILSGMRISLGVCWMCVVAAEMLPGTPVGLGFMIMHAFSIARSDVVITGMICIGLCNALMDLIFRLIERRYLAWNKK